MLQGFVVVGTCNILLIYWGSGGFFRMHLQESIQCQFQRAATSWLRIPNQTSLRILNQPWLSIPTTPGIIPPVGRPRRPWPLRSVTLEGWAALRSLSLGTSPRAAWIMDWIEHLPATTFFLIPEYIYIHTHTSIWINIEKTKETIWGAMELRLGADRKCNQHLPMASTVACFESGAAIMCFSKAKRCSGFSKASTDGGKVWDFNGI